MKRDWIVFTPHQDDYTMTDVLHLETEHRERLHAPEKFVPDVHIRESSDGWFIICVALLIVSVWWIDPTFFDKLQQKAVNIWEEKVVYVPETAALEEKDMRFVRTYIRSRVGNQEYTRMIRLKCLDQVAYKLSVFDSSWEDNYCANEYRNLEARFKDDLMMYMTYRYEASQPVTILNQIKQSKLARN